jgi:multiple sugar transport system ATP-binding protein
MATVRYDNATRVYEGADRPAVDALNLEISDGEFMVLVGPSGCGKSTSLRMLAGLEEVNGGAIFIGDRDVSQVPPKDRDIAMVFQNYALYPHMTVADNMAFALKMQGVDKATRLQRVKEAAKLLDLEPFLERKPKALSGGQRQRVAMGRAIVREPQVSAWTSRCPTWTPSCGCPPAPRSPHCSAGSASPPSTSPTTRWRP